MERLQAQPTRSRPPTQARPPAQAQPTQARPANLSLDEREVLQKLLDADPVTWMEKNFFISDPRHPLTGKRYPPGPIRLHPVQKRILRAALFKVNGMFPYSTILFSTIKKSGKTRIAAAVACWFAATQDPYNEIYCLANDGKQSTDRILAAIKQCIRLNPELNESWKVTQTRVSLPNGTFIEAVPCDPSGQAGANPGLTVWSEMWGYRHQHKERLWTEMTIPPTRFGRAIRWVESYVGYVRESNVLYDLYQLGVENGRRHRAFIPESGPGASSPPVYVNEAASMLAYWDEGMAARRMPWQTGKDGEAYYRAEAAILVASEFERIHCNLWVDPVQKAIPLEWWDACQYPVPVLDPRTPIVVGVDASVSGDCTSCIAVSRHPEYKEDQTMVRMVRIWEPPRGGKIDLGATVETTILKWIREYNVVEIAYDEYQLHKMMTDLRKKKIVKLWQFGQTAPRSKADKQMYDMIRERQIAHDGNRQLREHVDNADAKTQSEKYRFVKPETTSTTGQARKQRPIDGLVALSMANDECLRLRLT